MFKVKKSKAVKSTKAIKKAKVGMKAGMKGAKGGAMMMSNVKAAAKKGMMVHTAK